MIKYPAATKPKIEINQEATNNAITAGVVFVFMFGLLLSAHKIFYLFLLQISQSCE